MAVKKTFLWQISGQQLPATSYLFGTMHVQDKRAFSQLRLVEEKIDACEVFAAEFDLDKEGESGNHHLLLPPGTTLRTLLPEKKYLKLKRIFLKSAGINIDHFQNTSPFMLTNLIGGNFLKNDRALNLDKYLWEYARASSKILIGVETIEEQLAVLGKISLEVQLKMLLNMGRKIKSYRRHSRHAAELYCRGELYRLSKSVVSSAGKLRKILLYPRNVIMADRIYGLVQKHSLFAAVGAGHLAGGKGVIRLLRQKGLRVRPVTGSSKPTASSE